MTLMVNIELTHQGLHLSRQSNPIVTLLKSCHKCLQIVHSFGASDEHIEQLSKTKDG